MRKKPAYNQIKYPIWFIATFVAITELIVVLGLIKTSGIVQLLLTIFAISFPIFVVAVFFHFLLIKPDTLHLPSEYTAQLEGVVAYEDGRYSAALEAFEKAIKEEPFSGQVWSNKGAALRALGRHEEAINALDKAIELEPDLSDARNNKGAALASLGRYEEALKCFEKAIQLKPAIAESWNNKGNVLRNLGRYEEALHSYQKAIAIKPDTATSLYNIACSLSRIDQKEKSLEYLQRAIQLDPAYKEKAVFDDDFETMRDDEEFRELAL